MVFASLTSISRLAYRTLENHLWHCKTLGNVPLRPWQFHAFSVTGILLLSSYLYIPTFYNNKKKIREELFLVAATCLVITWHRCLYCGQNNSTMRTNSLLSFSFFLPSRSACFCLFSLPKLYKCLVNIFYVLWESDIKRLISFPALPADLTLSKVCMDHLSVSKPDSTL